MKYYSEKLDKLFDNKQDLFIAEREYNIRTAQEEEEEHARILQPAVS